MGFIVYWQTGKLGARLHRAECVALRRERGWNPIAHYDEHSDYGAAPAAECLRSRGVTDCKMCLPNSN